MYNTSATYKTVTFYLIEALRISGFYSIISLWTLHKVVVHTLLRIAQLLCTLEKDNLWWKVLFYVDIFHS